jgi:HEAT repeat protein
MLQANDSQIGEDKPSVHGADSGDKLADARVRAQSGDDLLPPVEPPSAGFIIQLFVVPALIVLVIMGVWLSINWLVRTTSADPHQLIQGLEHGASVARWQRASELADMLRNSRFAELKQDKSAAAEIARILDRQIEAGGMEDDNIQFRSFLARALGEFEVQEGIDVLLKAAQSERDPREAIVRDAALQAIATRAHQLQQHDPPRALKSPHLERTLILLASDEDPAIRFQAAYALGKIGTPKAIEQLEVMVDDPDLDTRANAAISLAHRGNAAAVETLSELLDLEELMMARETSGGQKRGANPSVFMHPAMQAVLDLSKKNAKADLSLAIKSLERLAAADERELQQAKVPTMAVSEARRVLQALTANSDRRAEADR